MKKKILISVLSVLVLFIGCSKEEKVEKIKPKAPLVKVEEIKPAAIIKSVKLTGTVEAKVIANVLAPADGYIEKLKARENDFVRSDKQLAIIGTQERTSLVSQAKEKARELKSRLEKTTLGSPEYLELNSQLAQAKKELEYSERLFLGVPVISPLSGTITQKFIEAGSAVSAKQIIFTIVDFNSLVIKSSVSEDLFSKIKHGDKLKVKFNAFPENEFNARITLKYQQIDPVTRNFPVELKLLNVSRDIVPGMMCELELVTDRKDKVLIVPNDVFIVNQKDEKIVYTINDTTPEGTSAHKRIVTTGISNEKFTEVTSGLKAGEKIVIMGQELLKDGIKVMVQKQKEMKKETVSKKEGGKKK